MRERILQDVQSQLPFKPASSTSSKQVIQFTLEFPTLIQDAQNGTADEKSGLSDLPPSFFFVSDIMRVSISYNVRVILKRRGLLALNKTLKRNIELKPLSGNQSCLHDHDALLKTVNYLSTATLGIYGPTLDQGHGLPPYTPSIAFEVEVPPCRTVFPGDAIDLKMSFNIPEEFKHLITIVWVSNIVIRLRTKTTAVAGSNRRIHVNFGDCCSIRGQMQLHMPISGGRISIPPELWNNHTYPYALGSFRTSGVQREHQLEVVVDFAYDCLNNTHVSSVYS